MFLTYLSNFEYEEKYWPFIFRFETLIQGVVVEATRSISTKPDPEIAQYLIQVFSQVLDPKNKLVPTDWWKDLTLPDSIWTRQFFDREIPLIVRQIRQIAKEHNTSTSSNKSATNDEFIDRNKIKERAHQSTVFRTYLLGKSST